MPTLMVVPHADTMISLDQARAAAPAGLADLIAAFRRDPAGYLAASADAR
ncbi:MULTISPECIES: hypothetical protein [unclassified Rhodococcus (in: high G+C Gram-positive bacteria)]|nr:MULTISPECIES: hypothetical protein [unclassified Rhodococcus (in: high G+C Gram-positive bacteria)]